MKKSTFFVISMTPLVFSAAILPVAAASINISNITVDGEANRSYYDRAVQLDDIIAGEVESPMGNPVAQVLP